MQLRTPSVAAFRSVGVLRSVRDVRFQSTAGRIVLPPSAGGSAADCPRRAALLAGEA